jgi:hypothetical protein
MLNEKCLDRPDCGIGDRSGGGAVAARRAPSLSARQGSQSEPQRLKYAVLAMTIVPELFRHWFERPGFVRYVKHPYWISGHHAYWIGGYDVVGRGGIDLDEYGLEWVRTLTLRDRKTNIEMRIIDPQDLRVIVGPYPTDEQVVAMYGPPLGYEHDAYAQFLKSRISQ